MVSNPFVIDIGPLTLTLPLSGIYPMIRMWMLHTAMSLTFDFNLKCIAHSKHYVRIFFEAPFVCVDPSKQCMGIKQYRRLVQTECNLGYGNKLVSASYL